VDVRCAGWPAPARGRRSCADRRAAGAGEAALHRPDGPPELPRGLFTGVAFEVAEDERRAVGIPKAAELRQILGLP